MKVIMMTSLSLAYLKCMLKFVLLSQFSIESLINMHLFCCFIIILYFAQANCNEFMSPELWNSFKHDHKKQYINVEEENYR